MSAVDDDRQRIMAELAAGNGADRERARADAYASYYGPAAATRTAGVGTALAAGNAQDATDAAANLSRSASRYDQGHALDLQSDSLTRQASELAATQAARKAALSAPKAPTYYQPGEADDPWALFQQYLDQQRMPQQGDVHGASLYTKLAGGGAKPAPSARSQIPGVGALLQGAVPMQVRDAARPRITAPARVARYGVRRT